MQTDTWHGCYEQQLRDVIVPDAFAHPAKMSWALAQRIMDLPQQTAEMLECCGFRVVHWHEASLVARESQIGLFGGEERRARKSFFRRLAEKNGAPPIDAEVVLCAVQEEATHAD